MLQFQRFFDFFDKRTDISPDALRFRETLGAAAAKSGVCPRCADFGCRAARTVESYRCAAAPIGKNPVRHRWEIMKKLAVKSQKRRLFRRKPPLLSILFRTGPGHCDLSAVCRDTQCVRKNIARNSTVITHVPTFTSLIFPANTLITT